MSVCAISELLILLNQFPADENLPRDDSATLQKGEAAAEQNAASNLVNDGTTYTQRDEEFIDKASDVQVSTCLFIGTER